MIDIVVHRRDLNKKIYDIIEFITKMSVDKSNQILKDFELLHPKKD